MRKQNRLICIIMLLVVAISSFSFVACNKESGDDNTNTSKIEIKLNVNELNLRLYNEYTLSVKTSGDYIIEFVSDNTQVASVSNDGKIVANSVGTATITAKYEDASDSCLVTVYETSEIPSIYFLSVDSSNIVRLAKDDTFEINPSVSYDNQIVDASILFDVEDESVVTVSNSGVIKALKIGKTKIVCSATYRKWTVQKSFDVEVVGDTAVVLSKYSVELYSSDIVGQNTRETIDSAKVYSDNTLLENQPTINWTSLNVQVATVQNGIINAVSVGQTQVIASCKINGEEFSASVFVTVKQPELSAVTNLRIEDDKLKWDSVDYCDGYKLTANLVHEDLYLNEYDISHLYGKVEFTISPYSNNELVKNGEKVKYNTTFTTADITERTLVTSSSAEGSKISKVEDYTEDNVYFCDVSANSFSLGKGGIFKVVYMTPWFESRTNAEGKQPFNDVKAIVDNDSDLADFKDMTISFWAYGYDEDVTFSLARTSGSPSYESGATFYTQQTIQMREWTRVELRVNSDIYLSNYNLYAAILASGDFYYTDVHINTPTHTDKVDHSDCGFFAGMYFEQALSELPENMPEAFSENFAKFENTMLFALNEYSLLTPSRIVNLPEKTVKKFNSLKVDYIEYLILTLPSKESVTAYHGETINRASGMLKGLSEEVVSNIVGIDKLSELKTEYDKKFVVAFDTYNPWLSTELNAYERVDLGVNSYQATANYSTDRTYYEQYGTVTKVIVAQGSTEKGDTINNLHTLFDVKVLKALLEENKDVFEICFSILTKKASLWEINKVDSKVSTERVWQTLSLSANTWTEVVINRADILTTSGVLRRPSMTFDGEQTVYFSNFYLVKSTGIISPVVEQINALPQNVEEINMYHGSAIYSAFNAYDAIPEDYKSLVTNGAKLLELKEEYDKNYGVVFSTQEYSWIHDGRTGTYNATGVISMIDNADYGKVIKCEVAKKTEETNSQNYRVHFNNLKTFLSEHEEITQVKFKVYTTKTSSEYMVNGEYLRLEEGTWTEITLTREKVMAKESQTLSIGSFTSTAEQTLIFTNFYFVKNTTN